MYEGPTDPNFPSDPINPDDLMNSGRVFTIGKDHLTRELISDLDARILRDAYGYTINTLSRQTFLATYQASTGLLRINLDPDVANQTIELDYSSDYVSVNVDGIRSWWHDPTRVEVVTGNGNDHVFVYNTAPGIPTSIDSNGGDDVVTIGKDGSVRGIAGPVSVLNGSTLIIDDAYDPGTRSATISSAAISSTSITGLAPATIDYENVSTKRLDIYGGSGGNTFTFTGADTPLGPTTRLFAGRDIDTVNVRGTSGVLDILGGSSIFTKVNVGDNGSVQRIRGTLNIENENQYSRNLITVDASADATASTASLSYFANPDDSEHNGDLWGKIRGLAPADINYEYYDTELITIKPLPFVTDIVVNDGSAQRSMVTRLTVNFSVPVTIDPNAFDLRRRDGTQVGLIERLAADGRSVVLTFTGSGIIGSSLADGLYTLTVHGDKIHDRLGQALYADANGTQLIERGNYVDSAIERLFGDADGDGDVDNSDVFAFKAAYGKSSGQGGYQPFFDFNGDGTINTLDFAEVKQRYGKRI